MSFELIVKPNELRSLIKRVFLYFLGFKKRQRESEYTSRNQTHLVP